jgi:hypothetical protein
MTNIEPTSAANIERRALACDLETLQTYVASAVPRLVFEDPRFRHMFGEALIAELTSAIEQPGFLEDPITMDTRFEIIRDPRLLANLVEALQMHCWDFVQSAEEFKVYEAVEPVVHEYVT